MTTTAETSIIRDHYTATVEYRDSMLAGSWATLTAYNVSFTKSVGTSIGQAQFQYLRGDTLEAGETEFSVKNVDPDTLIGSLIKISAVLPSDDVSGFSTVYWYGVATEANQALHGDRAGPVQFATDDITIICHDLKWLLNRKQITRSKVVHNGAEVEVERGLTFNQRDGVSADQARFGNYDNGFFIFAADVATSIPWTAEDIVVYLLREYPPTPGVLWDLDVGAAQSLVWYEPTITAHGRTLLELLNECIPTRRGVTWTIEVDEGTPKYTVKLRSFLESNLTLPGGGTISANPDTVDIDVTGQPHVSQFTRTASKQTRFSQVCVQGQRRGVVATYRCNNELVQAWPASLTPYSDGAKNDLGYSGQFAEKAQQNDSARMNHPLRKYFTTYRLETNWDGITNGVDVSQGKNFYQDGLRFLPRLPLLTNYDYSTDPANPTLLSDKDESFMNPLVIIDLDPISRFESIDKLGSSAYSEYWGDGVHWACSIVMADNYPGMELKPTGCPHLIGKGQFNELTAEPTEQPPLFDWRTLEATLYLQFDDFCQGEFPAVLDPDIADQQAVLYIDIGDRAKLDYLAQGTVLKLSGGNKVTASTGGYVRDDRTFCQDVAKAAWSYYGIDRQAISLELNQLGAFFSVGHLVENISQASGSIPVNSLITSITWDFARGTTEVRTSLAELDIASLI